MTRKSLTLDDLIGQYALLWLNGKSYRVGNGAIKQGDDEFLQVVNSNHVSISSGLIAIFNARFQLQSPYLINCGPCHPQRQLGFLFVISADIFSKLFYRYRHILCGKLAIERPTMYCGCNITPKRVARPYRVCLLQAYCRVESLGLVSAGVTELRLRLTRSR